MSSVEPKTITRKYKYFDENFTSQVKDVTAKFIPAIDYAEAVSRFNGDANSMLAALNVALENSVLETARREAIGGVGLSKKAVLDFIKPFRNVPRHANLVTKEKGQDGWKEQYTAQTDAILAEVKAQPFFMDAIRAAAANVAETGEDEE